MNTQDYKTKIDSNYLRKSLKKMLVEAYCVKQYSVNVVYYR